MIMCFKGISSQTFTLTTPRLWIFPTVITQAVDFFHTLKPGYVLTDEGNNRTNQFLERVIRHKQLHGLWLNTLSFLEYMGSRKIAKALPQEEFNEVLLGHLSEEVRHSLYFKKQARHVSGQNYGFHKHELLAGAAGPNLFSKLRQQSRNPVRKGHFSKLPSYNPGHRNPRRPGLYPLQPHFT